MKGLGALMLIMGVGSLLLPMVGMQFRIFSIFGAGAPFIGAVAAIVGAIVLVWSLLAERHNSGGGGGLY